MKYVKLTNPFIRLRNGDEVSFVAENNWLKMIGCAGFAIKYWNDIHMWARLKYRRPITGNKSNAAQRAIKRGNKKTGRA